MIVKSLSNKVAIFVKSVFSLDVLKRKSPIFIPLLFVYIFSFTFCSASTDAKYEMVSSYITEVSNKYSSTKSTNIDVLSVDDDITHKELHEITFNSLLANSTKTTGSFYNYRTMYNSNIETYFKLTDLDDISPSVLLHTNGSDPHVNAKNEYVYPWFEVKVMFEKGNPTKPTDSSYCLIRQSMANALLEKMAVEKQKDGTYTKADYQFLLENKSINIRYVYAGYNEELKWTINNIILDGEGYDSFFTKTFGDYLTLCIASNKCLPTVKGFSINFDFGTSTVDSNNYLKYINSNFSNKYEYRISRYNLNVGSKFENKIHFIENNLLVNGLPAMVVFGVLTAVVFAYLVFVFFILTRSKNCSIDLKIDLFRLFVCFEIVYLFFLILSSFSNTLLVLFSNIAICFNLLVSFLLSIAFLTKAKGQVKTIKEGYRYCEVNI